MYIYLIRNNLNNMIYIGKQVRNNKLYMGSGKLIKLAIKKYGIDNFKKEIIEYCENKSILSEREIFWIKEYNSRDRTIGYNIAKGGEGNYNNVSFLGKHLSDSHRKKISDNHADISGDKNPMFGKSHTKESKTKIRNSRLGTSASEDTKSKMSKKKKGENNNNSKLTESIVIEIRNEMKNSTIKDISLKYNLKKSCVWKIVNNYTWKHI